MRKLSLFIRYALLSAGIVFIAGACVSPVDLQKLFASEEAEEIASSGDMGAVHLNFNNTVSRDTWPPNP